MDAHRVRERGDAAGVADPLHAFGKLRLAAVYVALGRFVQVIVEGLLEGGYISLFEHDLSEVRPSRQTTAAGLHFFQGDVEAEFLQTSNQPLVAVAARSLHVQDPVTKFRRGSTLAEEISQQVHRAAVQLGGQLDTAHQLDTRLSRPWDRLVVARKGVVVGDAEQANAYAYSLFDQLRGRAGAIGFIRMRVQIDHRK